MVLQYVVINWSSTFFFFVLIYVALYAVINYAFNWMVIVGRS